MPGKSITLDLPEDLYERVRQVAEQSQRPLERVLVESIRLVLQRTFIPVDCIALAGACDGRHRPHGSAVARKPRGQAPPVRQRPAWVRSLTRAPARAGQSTPALFF